MKRRLTAAACGAALLGSVAVAAMAQTALQAAPSAPAGAIPPAADEGDETPAAVTPPPAATPYTPSAPTPQGASAPAQTAKPKAAAPVAVEAKPAPKRALYNAAVLQALDKVTTETLRFEAPLNKPIRYKGLIFTVHTCQVEPSGTLPPAEAHLQVISQPIPLTGRPATPAREVFRGWMYAGSPGIHPFEHPVYDVWLIACKTAAPVNAASR